MHNAPKSRCPACIQSESTLNCNYSSATCLLQLFGIVVLLERCTIVFNITHLFLKGTPRTYIHCNYHQLSFPFKKKKKKKTTLHLGFVSTFDGNNYDCYGYSSSSTSLPTRYTVYASTTRNFAVQAQRYCSHTVECTHGI